jgi:TonB-dependent starch-binding outer membrane protein SusC
MRKLFLLILCVICASAASWAQTIEASGKVTDDKGNPIPRASVRDKNSRKGTSAGLDGSFKLSGISATTTLVVSAAGFETKEVKAGTGLNIELAVDVRALSEVVVTGTGVATSKKRTAFAVESVTADKLPQAPTADIGNALVGKIAGAQISSVGGSPGQGTQILLRGINTITNGTNPMILLDGIEVRATNLESLDLSNIERVEVVQGAASASIYGAQGANGVIQLFSKKGKQGKVSIDFTTSVATNELLNIGGVQKSKYHSFNVNANNEVVRSNGTPLAFDPVTGSYLNNPVFNLIDPNSKADKLYDKNLLWYDHYKMFFTRANTFNNSLSISGAKEKFDFSIVASDSRQETVFKNNGNYSRTNLSTNIGVELFKNLRLRSTTQLVSTKNTQLDADGRNMLYAINNSRPFANYEQRDAAGFHSPYFGDAVGVNGYNFNYIIENAKYSQKNLDVVQNLNLNYKFAKFVELDAKYGINRASLDRTFRIAEQSHSEGAAYWEYWAEWYSPRTSYGVPASSDESGEINQRSILTLFQNLNATATIRFDFEKDFGLKIPLQSTTLVGYDYRKSKQTDYISYGLNAPSYTPYTTADMGSFKVQLDDLTEFATYGYLVNQRFEYLDIAGVSAGFRSDYSSAFGRGSKPFTFPRGDAYVRLSRLDFWKNSGVNNIVNEWKLRAAYGEAGIQPDAYARFPILDKTTVGTQNALSSPVTYNNPDLRIEVSKELEIGTDLGFKLAKGKWLSGANLSFTYWDRTSDDVIDRIDVAPSIGIGRQLTNLMTLKSNGIQASLSLNVLTDRDWSWNFTANFSKQKSYVHSIQGNAEIIKQSAAGSSQYVITAGEQIGQLYGYIFLNAVDQKDKNGNLYIPQSDHGLYEVASNGYVVNKTTKQPFASAGRYPLGDPNPNFNMSFINELNYKKFVTLNFQWDWVNGSNLYNQTKEWMYRDGIHADYANPITIGGVTAPWTAFYRGAYAVRQANGTKSYFMEDASFVRLRNIALGVDLARFIKVKGINRVQLVLSGRNLVTFTKYTGYDPEISSGTLNSAWDRGVDHNTIPNVKTYQATLNLGF